MNQKNASALKDIVLRRRRARRRNLWLSFILVVLLPAVTGSAYLFNIAIDQYHSTTAFSVRSDESISVSALQNAFTQGASPSKIDAEIIQEFIRSQAIVERINARVDLQTIYIRVGEDFVFELSPDAGIEDLVRYWNRMVSVTVAANSGLVELRVKAFSPQDAHILSGMILEESSDVVNALSVSAEDNYMEAAYTRRLETEETLRMARSNVQAFRSKNEIIDPENDYSIRTGVIAALQNELAKVLIEKTIIDGYSEGFTPRTTNIELKIEAIRTQIDIEESDIYRSENDGMTFSGIMQQFEALLVNQQIAEEAYRAALIQEETARSAARRQARFITVHIPPTLSQESQYPDRLLLCLVLLGCLFAAWCVAVLIFYNVEDRS